eukprot:GFKZ01009260.1.p4 GENE.GFKZ01009260.1~~GFKZ01009260.1.p4  ORF type:complete len:128 (-),score=1.19 GFKZ01009260.1:339-698(-)
MYSCIRGLPTTVGCVLRWIVKMHAPVNGRTTVWSEQHVDLSKLRKQSLKRYKKHFNLDVKADSKTELLEAVGRHFATMPVREADVALEFHNYARSIRGKRSLGAESSVDPPAAPAAAGR